MYRCEVTAVVRKKGVEGYPEIQEFVMKESINRMTVVGENQKVLFIVDSLSPPILVLC